MHLFPQATPTEAIAPAQSSKERLQLSLKLMSSMLGMLTSQIGDIMLPRRDSSGKAPPESPAALTELWDSFLEAHATETRLRLADLAAGKVTLMPTARPATLCPMGASMHRLTCDCCS